MAVATPWKLVLQFTHLGVSAQSSRIGNLCFERVRQLASECGWDAAESEYRRLASLSIAACVASGIERHP